METPFARFVFEALVDIAPAVVQGETASGVRRFIPITGGRLEGPELSGEVLPGGADWQHRPRRSGCDGGGVQGSGRRVACVDGLEHVGGKRQ